MVKRRVSLSATVDLEDFEALEELARERRESISSLVREAVKRYLKEVRGE